MKFLKFIIAKNNAGNPANSRFMLLLVLDLYQSLPHFVPKASIEFPFIRNRVWQTLELSNLFNKLSIIELIKNWALILNIDYID